MTTKDTALRLALEALRQDRAWLESDAPEEIWTLNNDALAAVISAYHEALAQPAGERGELIRKAMRKAYSLGQTYWQQADSEFTSHHKKADVTQAKFIALVEETAALLSADAQPSAWVGLSDEEANELWESTDSDWELMKRTEKFLREKNAGKSAAEDKAGWDEPVAWRWLYDGKPDGEKCFPLPGPDEDVVRAAAGMDFPRTVQFLYAGRKLQADVPETSFGNMKGGSE